MKIIIGRGRGRTIYELPHGSVFRAAEKNEPEEYRGAMLVIRRLLGFEK